MMCTIADVLIEVLESTTERLSGWINLYGTDAHVAKTWFYLPEDEKCRVRVRGTALTLVAAKNRTEHAALLLRRGADVNAAAPETAQDLIRVHNYDPSADVLAKGFGGVAESFLALYADQPWECRRKIWHLTPLAAAIACGSVETTELLLRQPGVRVEDSSAVCRAAVLALNGTPRQKECARMAFRLTGPEERMAEELLGHRVIDPGVIADLCTLRQLALRLRGAPCTAEQLVRVDEALSGCLELADADELCNLLEAWPKERQECLAKYVLPSPLRTNEEEAAVVKCWHSGTEQDISGLPENVFSGGLEYGAEVVERTILRLADGGTLCAAAESPWIMNAAKYGEAALSCLLENVRFYRSASVGISALAAAVLRTNNLDLLRLAARLGVFDNIPRTELVLFLSEFKLAPVSRACILAYPLNAARAAETTKRPKGWCWTGRWRDTTRIERHQWLARAWEEPLSYEESLDRVDTLACDRGFTLESPTTPQYNRARSRRGELLFPVLDGAEFPFGAEPGVGNLYLAAVCGENPELLRAALDFRQPHDALTELKLGNDTLSGSLLCLAAANGRTEQTALLLARGADANEDKLPARSRVETPDGARTIVTPLAMAERGGYAETAALLRAHGARPAPEWMRERLGIHKKM